MVQFSQSFKGPQKSIRMMWGLCLLLVVGTVSALDDADAQTYIPPYVQSKTAFTHTRLLLQESVPRESQDIIVNPEARKHLAFGILAAVTGCIAKNHSEGGADSEWLSILHKHVPHTWENYNAVSMAVNKLLAEASAKIQPISSLIDALCSTASSVDECNAEVFRKVLRSDEFIKRRARLLIALGDVSKVINDHEKELKDVVRKFNVVPYLLKQIEESPGYKSFIQKLSNVYNLLRKKNATPEPRSMIL